MVTIVIPAYNRAKTIGRSIESVLKQTYGDFELIIVDDCSNDNTEEVVKSYDDKRIKYVRLDTNGGACIARNKGIDLAKGEYVAFQDSDDVWLENKLENQLENMSKNNSDLDFCSILVDGEKEKGILRKPIDKQVSKIRKEGVAKALCDGNFISTQAIVGKTEWFRRIKFDPEMPRMQDYDLALRMVQAGAKWSFTEEPGAMLFLQDDSLTKDDTKFMRAVDLIKSKDYGLAEEDQKRLHASLDRLAGGFYRSRRMKGASRAYTDSLKNKFSLAVLARLVQARILEAVK